MEFKQWEQFTPNTKQVFSYVADELNRATAHYAPMNSAHEGFAVLGEEFYELWQEVIKSPKKRDMQAMTEEAVQTAAMAIRFLVDVCLKEG